MHFASMICFLLLPPSEVEPEPIVGMSLAEPAVFRKHHGPGTTGAGLTTESGETLEPGAVSLSLRFDATLYEGMDDNDILSSTARVNDPDPHFEVLKWAFLQTLELRYGVAEDFELGWSMGYYRGNDLREGHDDMGTLEVHGHGDVSGATDQWLTGKVRVMSGADGHLALLGGVKFPTGRDDVKEENGVDPLDGSLQPGSGAFDFSLGAAYSRWLSERISMDASLKYVYRTEEDSFKVGDRFDAGAAVAYRFTEEATTYPNVSVFGEVNLAFLLENEEDDVEEVNSGGTVLFLSPGVRLAVSEKAAFFLAIQVPVVQDLNDEQQETELKLSGGITLSF